MKKIFIIAIVLTLLLGSFGGVGYASEKEDKGVIVYKSDLLDTEEEILEEFNSKKEYKKVPKFMKEKLGIENKLQNKDEIVVAQVLESRSFEDGTYEDLIAITLLSYGYGNQHVTAYGGAAGVALVLTLNYRVRYEMEDGVPILGTFMYRSTSTLVKIITRNTNVYVTSMILKNEVVDGNVSHMASRVVTNPTVGTTYGVNTNYYVYINLPSGMFDKILGYVYVTCSNSATTDFGAEYRG